MTPDGLRALAAFLPIFERPDFCAGEWVEEEEIEPGVFSWPFVAYGPEASAFEDAAYEHGWISRDFVWSDWKGSSEARALRDDPAALARATPEQLGRLLTVCIRQNRFVEGALLSAFESGLIRRIVCRIVALVETQSQPQP